MEILLNASRGVISVIPKRAGTAPKSRWLKVTRPSALPLIAASSTISSAGSSSCGRHKNRVATGLAIAQSAETNALTSDSSKPDATRCLELTHTASYSSAKATDTTGVKAWLKARSSKVAEAPEGLRKPATITLVSKTNNIIYDIIYDVNIEDRGTFYLALGDDFSIFWQNPELSSRDAGKNQFFLFAFLNLIEK